MRFTYIFFNFQFLFLNFPQDSGVIERQYVSGLTDMLILYILGVPRTSQLTLSQGVIATDKFHLTIGTLQQLTQGKGTHSSYINDVSCLMYGPQELKEPPWYIQLFQ